MIRKISKYLLKLLKQKCPIPPNEQDIYEYGIDVLLYTVLSTTGLLFLGLLYGQFTESIVIIAILYLNQTLGGGFHASTHLHCFATMAIGLSCCLSTLFIPFPLLASVIIALTSAGFMLRFPLVLHVNKAYLSSKRQLFFNRSRRALIFQLLVFCLFVICEDAHMAQTISLGLLACVFSRAIAVAQQKRDGIL